MTKHLRNPKRFLKKNKKTRNPRIGALRLLRKSNGANAPRKPRRGPPKSTN